MTKAKVLRIGVLIVTAASLVHVSLLLPKFLALVGRATGWGLVPAAAVFVAFLAAVAGSVLAIILLARSWARPEVRALAVFMAAAAASWGAILRLMSFGVDGSGISAFSSGGFLDGYVLLTGLMLVAASFLRFSALFPTALSEQAIPRHGRSPFLRRMRVRLLRPGLVWVCAEVREDPDSVAHVKTSAAWWRTLTHTRSPVHDPASGRDPSCASLG